MIAHALNRCEPGKLDSRPLKGQCPPPSHPCLWRQILKRNKQAEGRKRQTSSRRSGLCSALTCEAGSATASRPRIAEISSSIFCACSLCTRISSLCPWTINSRSACCARNTTCTSVRKKKEEPWAGEKPEPSRFFLRTGTGHCPWTTWHSQQPQGPPPVVRLWPWRLCDPPTKKGPL